MPLKAVAIFFIMGGIAAAIEVLVSLMHSHINVNLGVLAIFIGTGLLKLRPGWRTCALVFLWIAMIGIPIFVILMLFHSGPLDFRVFGQKVGYTSKVFGFVIAIVMFILAFWQYHVLTRPDVRKLFGVETDQQL